MLTTDAETVIVSARGTDPASRGREGRGIGADNLRIRQPKLIDRSSQVHDAEMISSLLNILWVVLGGGA